MQVILRALVTLLVLAKTALGDESESYEESHGRKLLVTGHKRFGNSTGGGRTCMAEDVCINKFCGNGYDHTANKFPYTITYSKFPTKGETTFEFDVCMKACTQEERYCEPLLSWSLRLDTELVKHKEYIANTTPSGKLLEECDETGLGYRWEGDQLQGLESHEPWQGERCEKFRVTVRHDPHQAHDFWLTDVCQQRIDIVATKNGKTMFSQSSVVVAKDKFSDVGSCLVHFRTRGGVFGFTLLEDWEYKIKDLRPEENTPEDLPDKVLDS